MNELLPDPLLWAAGALLYTWIGFTLVDMAMRRYPERRSSAGARLLVATVWPLALLIAAGAALVHYLTRSAIARAGRSPPSRSRSGRRD